MNKTITTTSASQQALWFLVVGASAALVHFLVLVIVVSTTSITPAWANVIAFLIAFVVSFLGHFYLTFRQSASTLEGDKSSKTNLNQSSHNSPLKMLVKWFASSTAGFMANQSLFLLGLHWFGERYYMLIWLLVTGIITVMTISRYY